MSVYRYEFSEEVAGGVVESQLALSVVVAECIYGRARVRLEASYFMSEDNRKLVLAGSQEVGRYVAHLLTGLLIREIGEDQFAVEQVEDAQTYA